MPVAGRAAAAPGSRSPPEQKTLRLSRRILGLFSGKSRG